MTERERFLLLEALHAWRIKLWYRCNSAYDVMSDRHAEIAGFIDWKAMWEWHANRIGKFRA